MRKILVTMTICFLLPFAASARKMEYTFGDKEGQPILRYEEKDLIKSDQIIASLDEIKTSQKATNDLLKEIVDALKKQGETNEKVVLKLAEYIKTIEQQTNANTKRIDQSIPPSSE